MDDHFAPGFLLPLYGLPVTRFDIVEIYLNFLSSFPSFEGVL